MRRYIPWACALIILILVSGITYGVMQQIERQGADDTPMRLASQVASELADGGSSGTVGRLPRVNLSNSLAPFVVVFGADGKPTSGNGYLHGTLASPPPGVISTAREGGEDDVTWQPTSGLRFATVSIKSGDHVVMAGQSLAPSERRTGYIGVISALGGLVSVAILVVAFIVWQGYTRVAARSRN
ncbi:MAG TPA: hypothetical protein VN045_15955 [Microbacteriaceae bacterium]|jgi:hypothetical protein|nr:hypothetical protein [Microbacteriaceae bacterium]